MYPHNLYWSYNKNTHKIQCFMIAHKHSLNPYTKYVHRHQTQEIIINWVLKSFAINIMSSSSYLFIINSSHASHAELWHSFWIAEERWKGRMCHFCVFEAPQIKDRRRYFQSYMTYRKQLWKLCHKMILFYFTMFCTFLHSSFNLKRGFLYWKCVEVMTFW